MASGRAASPRVRRLSTTAWAWTLALTAVVIAAYPFLPPLGRTAAYHGVGVVAVVAILAGVRLHGLRRPLPWILLAGGQLLFVAGDAVWDVYDLVLHLAPAVSPADLLYLGGYPVLAAGLAILGRRRSSEAGAAGLIDSAIVTIGAVVVCWAFLIAPYASDHTLDPWARLTAIAYPVGDLLLLAMATRLFLLPVSGSAGYRLLGAGLLAVLTTDVLYAALTLGESTALPERFVDMGWLAGYALVGAAVLHPAIADVPATPRERRLELTRTRLCLLAAASLLAPATLAIQTVTGAASQGVLIAASSGALFLLVLVRMSGLMRRVEEQAAELATVARTDALTGVPNRRAWDERLTVELARASRSSEPVSIALLDLDRFKAYNDAEGHPAGDRLLREAATAWRGELRAMDVLARYGGEEFGVVLPGCDAEMAAAVVDRLRALTPGGQTSSAGVVIWDGAESADALVGRADGALYSAKRAGRDRTVVGEPAAVETLAA
jgi:diguanylate cyclase (GGDEF)-like protein